MAKGTIKMDNLGMIYPTIPISEENSIAVARVLSNLDDREFNIETDNEVLYLSLPYNDRELITQVLENYAKIATDDYDSIKKFAIKIG